MQVYRCNISKYQSANYAQQEKELIEQLDLHYMEPEIGATAQPDIVITNSNTDVIKQDFDWSRVKLLIHPNSGYDNIHPDVIQQMQGPIILGNPIRANAVTTYTLSCLFQALVPRPINSTWDPKRQWNRKNIDQCHLLIIGYGHIGKQLYSSLSPLTPHIKIYDPYCTTPNSHEALDNLKHFDAIILAPSLTSTSFHMINKKFLQQLSEHVVIINGARGKLIEQNDLYEFLEQHPHSQAFIDVFEQEPANFKAWEKFQKAGQVHLTSHIAGVYQGLDQAILQFVETTIRDFINMEEEKFLTQYHSLVLQEKLKQVPTYD